jgi:fimbrial chaperone protein
MYRLLRFFALCLLAVFAPVGAHAMTVQPVVIDLTTLGQGMSQVVTVENTFANPLPVEIRVERLEFDANGAKGTGVDDNNLLVFPQQALIQPGQKQTFRVQWVGDPTLARSQHYFVTIAQLPVQLPDTQSAIQILYNFQILASVAANGKTPDLRVLSAHTTVGADQKPTVTMEVQNSADTYGYLSQGRLTVVAKDAAGRDVLRRTLDSSEIQQTIGFGLIGPGQRRNVALPVEVPSDGGRVEVIFTPTRRR